MDDNDARPRIDAVTVIGLALLLMPLMTMWHELGGHAAACVALGGRVTAAGAFYVDCAVEERWRAIGVAVAGVKVDTLLAVIAWLLWRGARGGVVKLALWYLWIGKAFVASGYLLFSGVTGVGDLGVDAGGGFEGVPYATAIRIAEVVLGAILYWKIVMAGMRSLSAMIGTGPQTVRARRTIAHLYYAMVGLSALAVGVLNPVGLFVTVASAAASSFGGQAGMISIGFAPGREDEPHAYSVGRRWAVLAAGIIMVIAFALTLGPTLR